MGVTLRFPLSVALDARRWGRTGLGRYQSELYRHLRVVAPELTITLAGAPPDAATRLGAGWVPFGAPLYSLREQLLGGRAMRRASADLYHFPHYAVPMRPPRPYVVTVHDLIHFRYPVHFGRAKVAVARHVLRRAVSAAAAVICVSDSTRRDLLAVWPDVAARVHVTHDGVSDWFSPAPAEAVDALVGRHGLGRYVLSMGDREPHKRFDLVASAFERMRVLDPDLRLAIVGERGPSGVADPPGAVRLGYVDDEQLRTLYSGARCLLFPSEYEGFGLPPLEAMACGCPVVCGRGSSLDEVVGAAAVQVAPDAAAIADAARALLDDPTHRRAYVEAGFARVRAFSWEATARATLAIFAEVVAANHPAGGHPIDRRATTGTTGTRRRRNPVAE